MIDPNKTTFTPEEVRGIVADMKLSLLHPEFGTEWQKGGSLFNLATERDSALAKVKELETKSTDALPVVAVGGAISTAVRGMVVLNEEELPSKFVMVLED